MAVPSSSAAKTVRMDAMEDVNGGSLDDSATRSPAAASIVPTQESNAVAPHAGPSSPSKHAHISIHDKDARHTPRVPSEPPTPPDGRSRPLFARRRNSRQLRRSTTDRAHDETHDVAHRKRSGRMLSFSRTRTDSRGEAKRSADFDGGVSPDARLTHSHDQSTAGTAAAAPRRPSVPGAKPVAPSWHPDAPAVIKVRSPIDSVLLPDLPLAGTSSSNGNGRKDGITVEDRILASSVQIDPLEAQHVIDSDSVKLQRPSIKVRIITWNQGNSVPKGDLGVLLGRVGEYIAPEDGWDESDDDDDDDENEAAGTNGEPDRDRNGKASSATSDEAGRATKPKRHRGMGLAGQENIPRKHRIPPLPHDDAHPYHVIVIAGQECPWGDGKRIATGVGMANELGDLGRSKSRAAYIAKERERGARAREKEKEREGQVGLKTPGLLITGADEDDPFFNSEGVTQSPMIGSQPATPGALIRGRGGARGWGEMCEDWLCRGPLAQATATKGLALASSSAFESASAVQTPEGGSSPIPTRSQTPNLLGRGDLMADSSRASSMDDLRQLARSPNASSTHLPDALGPSAAPSPARRKALNVPRVIRSISRPRLEASPSKADPSDAATTLPLSSETNSASLDSASFAPGPPAKVLPAPAEHDSATKGQASEGDESKQIAHGAAKAHHRLAIRIPGLSGSHHVTVQSDGTPASLGPYELVCKERCYMMYTAVYVWRGCLDRVHGVSQGHVKSGLLAGRVGNKGAVGISLKLGESRLLFVNAHLAAHEGKVAERIANVEKIKKELKVDTFLPKDDPRNDVDDLAACFDYAFWLGDLNFRVDITRRHADWLMMKKQYDHALAFDQLRRIMKEQPEVFNGYREATITFPPTFKYDVLKTIKAKKLEDKIRKQSATTMADMGSGQSGNAQQAHGANASGGNGVMHSSSSDLSERRASVIDMIATPLKSQDGNIFVAQSYSPSQADRTEIDDDASSISSSAVNSSSFGGYASEPDDASMPTSPETGASPSSLSPIDQAVAQNTAAVEGLGLHGRVIKARRRLLNVVQSAVGAVASQGGEDSKRSSTEQNRSRHASLQSAISQRPATDRLMQQSSSMTNVMSGTAQVDAQQSQGKPRRHTNAILYQPLTAAAAVVDPNSDSVDLESSLRRISDPQTSVITFAEGGGKAASATMDRGVQLNDSAPAPAEDGANGTEKQLYDTSAKQRVPSWCDRVLWRSNVEVEVDEDEEPDELVTVPESSRASRFTAAISSALSRLHVRNETLHSHAPHDGLRQAHTVASTESPIMSATPREPSTPATAVAGQSSPRRRWFARRRMTSDTVSPPTSPRSAFKRSSTFAHDVPTRSDSLEVRRITKRTHSAHDIPLVVGNGSTVDATNGTESNGYTGLQHGARVAGNDAPRLRVLSSPDARRMTSFQVDLQRRREVSSSTVGQGAGDLKGGAALDTATSDRVSRKNSQRNFPSIPPSASTTAVQESAQLRRHSRWNDFVSQLSNPQVTTTSALANFAFRGAARGSASDALASESEAGNHLRPPTQVEAEQDRQLQEDEQRKHAQDKRDREAYTHLIGPRRGEVECLLYKSLDDREMRLLEGRSDHRPVIFVGSIGVGHARAAK